MLKNEVEIFELRIASAICRKIVGIDRFDVEEEFGGVLIHAFTMRRRPGLEIDEVASFPVNLVRPHVNDRIRKIAWSNVGKLSAINEVLASLCDIRGLNEVQL